MKTLNEVVDSSAVGSVVFFLHLLDITDDHRQEILSWLTDHDVDIDPLSSDQGDLFLVKFRSFDDARLAQWIDRWENPNGSSLDPRAYRMIQVTVV